MKEEEVKREYGGLGRGRRDEEGTGDGGGYGRGRGGIDEDKVRRSKFERREMRRKCLEGGRGGEEELPRSWRRMGCR